jgi:hypothetical protein
MSWHALSYDLRWKTSVTQCYCMMGRWMARYRRPVGAKQADRLPRPEVHRGGDRNIMPHQPHLGVIAPWRKSSNIVLAGFLADTAEDHKRVAVVPGLAGAELEVVLAGTSRDGRAPRILRL